MRTVMVPESTRRFVNVHVTVSPSATSMLLGSEPSEQLTCAGFHPPGVPL